MKTCNACGVDKPLEDFYRKKSGKEGRQASCILCTKAYFQDWYAKNGDSVRERSLAVVRADPEANRAKVKEWRKANPEQRFRNGLQDKAKRRAHKWGVPFEKIDYDALPVDTCGICHEPIDLSLSHPDPWCRSLDHIKPFALGGGHVQDNVQWTHLSCNIRKRNRYQLTLAAGEH